MSKLNAILGSLDVVNLLVGAVLGMIFGQKAREYVGGALAYLGTKIKGQ
jgi:hypothetical protein